MAAKGRAWVFLLAAVLMVIAGSAHPLDVLAGEGLTDLDQFVSDMARSELMGPVSAARYVATTAEAAAGLLGKNRTELTAGVADSVFLVELSGSFSLSEWDRQVSGPYLAFLYWQTGDGVFASDYTAFQEPLPLETVGAPQILEPFALAHPAADRFLRGVLAFVAQLLAPILLVLSVILCGWRWRSRWPYALACCAAVATSAWQIAMVLLSLEGHSWDPAFHGVKVGVLVLVVCVDLAAAGFALRVVSRRRAVGQDKGDRTRWLNAATVLLVSAAVLYLASLYVLATSGE